MRAGQAPSGMSVGGTSLTPTGAGPSRTDISADGAITVGTARPETAAANAKASGDASISSQVFGGRFRKIGRR